MLFYVFETVSVDSERFQQWKQRFSSQNSMICKQWTLGSPKSLKFTVYLGTFLDYTSPVRVRMFWKSPDSCVSDNIDEVLKKSHQKILNSRKVTAFWKNRKFLSKNLTKSHTLQIWPRGSGIVTWAVWSGFLESAQKSADSAVFRTVDSWPVDSWPVDSSGFLASGFLWIPVDSWRIPESATFSVFSGFLVDSWKRWIFQ